MLNAAPSHLCFRFSIGEATKEALLNKLTTSKEDTSKVNLLLELGYLYSNSEPAAAKTYLNQAPDLSQKLNYKHGVYRSFTLYGGVFLFTAEFDSSLYYNFKAYEAAKETNDPLSPGIALSESATVIKQTSKVPSNIL